MLHELILALNGCHGQIFYVNEDDSKFQFKVNSALPLFHPAELGILQRILSVATDFVRIKHFIASHKSTSSQGSEDALSGLYVEAICEGLGLVLRPYQQLLMHLEKHVLVEGNTQLTFIQHKIQPFEPVFAAVNNLIRQLQIRQAHGCFILDIVYKASCSGVAQVQEAMKIILREGHKVLYKQLLAWLLQGSLFDPFEEFFIGVDEKSFVLTDKAGSTSHLSTMSDHTILSKSKLRHKLRAELVPGHISMKLAEKIFFIGESIQLFEADRKLEEQGSVLKDKETEFYHDLVKLRDEPEFHVGSFERYIDSIRQSVSVHLHALLLDRANLKHELWTARNFFLLGRGELFHTFIQQADNYLNKPPSATTQHDINQSFLAAVRTILPDEENVSKKIKIMLGTEVNDDESKMSKVSSKGSTIGWKLVYLHYTVPWPLHLIINESSLESYNTIFQFLLLVKRAQLALHYVWADMMSAKGEERSNKDWEVRWHMSFVIDNLQQYFMADVLESQFSILLKSIDASQNFEELRHAHDVFLNSVTSLTFVNNKSVHRCLSELLAACLHFSRMHYLPNDERKKKVVTDVTLLFGRQSGLLFQLLSSLRNHHTGTHLAQLLSRIDYNKYYSQNGHDVHKVVE